MGRFAWPLWCMAVLGPFKLAFTLMSLVSVEREQLSASMTTSICVWSRAIRGTAAVAAAAALAGLLSGCAGMSAFTGNDRTVTGSTRVAASANYNQPMPMQVASNVGGPAPRFLPPANVGPTMNGSSPAILPQASGQGSYNSVSSQDLPALTPSVSGSTKTMSAQPSLQQPPAAPQPVAPSRVAVSTAAGVDKGFRHTIQSGESLYSIARQYGVTTDSIVLANDLPSPDRIVVGQRIIIPGREGQMTEVASTSPVIPARKPEIESARTASIAPAARPSVEQASAPQRQEVAAIPAAAPAMPQPVKPAAADGKFRWPVSGSILTDFSASRTGINIAVQEGTAVRAAESGEVIYVGDAVEGYGNLILIKHQNGYVSAYAHLKVATVNKGDFVNRGDAIGTAGMTGAVNRPQLHFELRKGATPVDPMPMLAS